MPSRSRSRKSSRSSGRNPFKSASILKNGAQAPLNDGPCAALDDIELVARSQSILDDFSSPFAEMYAPSGDAPPIPATEDPMEPRNEPGSTGTRIDPSASGQRHRLPHKRFGLHTDQLRGYRPQGGLSMDYKQKYPEDPIYKETEENARVFHVYNDESQIFDDDMVIEAGDNLDILLVFAGLFASVLTTFVVQTSQSLSPDKTDVSNSLLREMISLQRAQENGTSFSSIPVADTSFAASRTDIWVNSLWFISLALSLSTALLAVIAKQWLRQYSSFISGTARERALIRQFRYDGLEKWRVRLIIGLLPTILHISLFLFLAGLVVFLLPLNNTLARVVAGIAGFLCGAYTVTNILPVIFIDCLYRTPLSQILISCYGAARIAFVALWYSVLLLLAHIKVAHRGGILWDTPWLPSSVRLYLWKGFSRLWPRSLKESERLCANEEDKWGRPLGIASALVWLAQTTSDISAKCIVAEAVGSVSHPLLISKRTSGTIHNDFDQQWTNTVSRIHTGELFTAEDERILERLFRGTLFIEPNVFRVQGVGQYEQTKSINHRLAHSTMLIIAAYHIPSEFHSTRDGKDLSPARVFHFVAGRKDLSVELEAPTWIWWSLFAQAADITSPWAGHRYQLIDLCTNGSIPHIDAHRESWLRKVNIPSTLRRAVWEHMLDVYRDKEDFMHATKPYTFLQFSQLFVRQNPPPPFSPVSLATFLFDNFAQFTDFWMETGDIHPHIQSSSTTTNNLS